MYGFSVLPGYTGFWRNNKGQTTVPNPRVLASALYLEFNCRQLPHVVVGVRCAHLSLCYYLDPRRRGDDKLDKYVGVE